LVTGRGMAWGGMRMPVRSCNSSTEEPSKKDQRYRPGDHRGENFRRPKSRTDWKVDTGRGQIEE